MLLDSCRVAYELRLPERKRGTLSTRARNPIERMLRCPEATYPIGALFLWGASMNLRNLLNSYNLSQVW